MSRRDDFVVTQLLAMRSQIDALLLALGGGLIPEEGEPAPCPHRETENVGTFGAPALRCVECRAIVPAPMVGA